MSSSIRSAEGELPPAHRRLWLASKEVVARAVGQAWAAGEDLRELLVVVAAVDVIIADVVRANCAETIVQVGNREAPLVALLRGQRADRLLQCFPGALPYRVDTPPNAFTLLTAPAEAAPGISTCEVTERHRLCPGPMLGQRFLVPRRQNCAVMLRAPHRTR